MNPEENAMNNRYVIPAAVALAVHAGLLFGFTKNPRPAPTVHEIADPVPFITVTLDPDEPVIITSQCGGPPIPPPPMPPPAGAESIVIEKTDRMPIELPLIQPGAFADTKEIIPIEFRSGDGVGAASWTRGIIPGGALDNPPRARFQTQPIYPFEEKKNGVTGEVLVDFEVDESGQVRNPRVTRSSSRAFEEPTLRAVAKWRFEPGKRHGKVVPFRMSVPVIFSLNE
jgi:protein TonB